MNSSVLAAAWSGLMLVVIAYCLVRLVLWLCWLPVRLLARLLGYRLGAYPVAVPGVEPKSRRRLFAAIQGGLLPVSLVAMARHIAWGLPLWCLGIFGLLMLARTPAECGASTAAGRSGAQHDASTPSY